MSSIRWHFEDETLCMGGRERAWCGSLVNGLARAAAGLRVGASNVPRYAIGPFDAFDLQIATAWALGSRPVKLAALIHGWCETNRVIEGEAFAVVADALEEGRELGIFREETQGYEGVDRIIERLRAGGDWCVWSYSVTDGFPRAKDDGESYYTKEETVALLREAGNVIDAETFDAPPHTGTLLTLPGSTLTHVLQEPF